MSRKWLAVIVAGIALAGCKKDNVAQVGDITITRQDLEYRKKVSNIYYPGSNKDYVALTQLLEGYLDEAVLKSLGHKVDEQVWEEESQRIDQNTKAPEVLKRIKDVYGLDKKAYLKTFIRVVYAERYLYNEVFLKDKSIHKAQAQVAQDFIQEVMANPAVFSKIAEEKKLQSSKMKLSEKEGITPWDDRKLAPARPDRPGPAEPAELEQAKMLIEKVSGLKPGAISPQIIEWQEGYQVLRLAAKEGDGYIVESVSIPKRGYDEWKWETASQVPVKIVDQNLKAELVKQVGWTSRLNFK